MSLQDTFNNYYYGGAGDVSSFSDSDEEATSGGKSKAKKVDTSDDSDPTKLRFQMVTKALDGLVHIARNKNPSDAARKLSKYLFRKEETGKKTVTIEGISRANKGKKYVYEATKELTTKVPEMMKKAGIKKIAKITIKSKN